MPLQYCPWGRPLIAAAAACGCALHTVRFIAFNQSPSSAPCSAGGCQSGGEGRPRAQPAVHHHHRQAGLPAGGQGPGGADAVKLHLLESAVPSMGLDVCRADCSQNCTTWCMAVGLPFRKPPCTHDSAQLRMHKCGQLAPCAHSLRRDWSASCSATRCSGRQHPPACEFYSCMLSSACWPINLRKDAISQLGWKPLD